MSAASLAGSRELRDALTRYVARRVPPVEVEDLVQDVLLRVHERLPEVEDHARLSGWVFRVARSVVVDHHRRRPRPALPAEDLRDEGAPADLPVAELVASWLIPMIATLPDSHREILELTEVEGLTQREAGERLGLSPSGARTRVQRARAELRRTLLRCCDVELDVRNRVVGVRPQTTNCCGVN
ncbi:MAG: sigma-70 family RNA polymerase sigma factor [Myxococcota bacterium]